jgi:nucleoside-diphosphate-sugar epimerase
MMAGKAYSSRANRAHLRSRRITAVIPIRQDRAGHVLDVGHLYRLALEKAPAGSQLYAAAEEGITVREIAETIGRHLNVPAVSIPAEQAADHFKAFPFMTLDITMSNADTRQLLDWEPVHTGLIADIEDGHYFTTD